MPSNASSVTWYLGSQEHTGVSEPSQHVRPEMLQLPHKAYPLGRVIKVPVSPLSGLNDNEVEYEDYGDEATGEDLDTSNQDGYVAEGAAEQPERFTHHESSLSRVLLCSLRETSCQISSKIQECGAYQDPSFAQNLKSATEFHHVLLQKLKSELNSESFALTLSWVACPALSVCGTSFSATDSVGGARPAMWLLGHSYIFWAGQRAAYRPGGRHLGFRSLDVHWRGIRGLMWPQVLPEVVGIAQVAASPVILLLHAGGNDLCSCRLAELLTTMRSDVDKFHGFFPKLVLIWSEVIPRVAWQGRDTAAVERSRRTLNARMSRFIRFKGGVVVRHRQLEGDNSSLMLPDGIHLSDIGLDIFLSGLQDGIEQALLLMGGGRSAV
ncbi:LOW QUALITY PROTEIN: uncharacterized protein ACNLHF_011452 [Anomaloglossus baeobatrachus]